jgi:chemotaxis protein CheD
MGRTTVVYLQPGEYFAGDAKHTVHTLLGSCVSIILWHPSRCVGAMSHFLLPTRGTPHVVKPDGRYGDEAMALMLGELGRFDVAPQECVAKIFGGGNMFPGHVAGDAMRIGARNGEAARELLQENGIRIVSENLFGNGHRKIVFKIANGDVLVG